MSDKAQASSAGSTKHPKAGPRKETSDDRKNFSDGWDKIFGKKK